MTFVLRRTDQWGGYVAKPGSNKAYVVNPAHARHFKTYDDANKNRCVDNEVVVEYRPKAR